MKSSGLHYVVIELFSDHSIRQSNINAFYANLRHGKIVLKGEVHIISNVTVISLISGMKTTRRSLSKCRIRLMFFAATSSQSFHSNRQMTLTALVLPSAARAIVNLCVGIMLVNVNQR
jgi:hypothetical protein